MCGTCTVLIDGKPVSACLTLAVMAQKAAIVTIEGLSLNEALHPIQQAFVDHNAFQCSYCTPGFILSTISLLKEYPNPDDQTIREYLAGNLCRCGSYVNILAAVQASRMSNQPWAISKPAFLSSTPR
jgi:aerobic-type carbon monoxide dehydrogenase small subunit (CoxS/CutS family)